MCLQSAIAAGNITLGTTFVINAAAYVNAAASLITAAATKFRHGCRSFRLDLLSAEFGTQKK